MKIGHMVTDLTDLYSYLVSYITRYILTIFRMLYE